MSIITVPEAAVRDYLVAFNLACIWAASTPSGVPTLIGHGHGRDLDRIVKRIRGSTRCELNHLSWVEHEAIAERVVAQTCRRTGVVMGKPQLRHIDEMIEALTASAKRLRVQLNAHDEVCARARDLIARSDQLLREAQSRGDLKRYNHAYKCARMDGAKMPPYGRLLMALRLELVRGRAPSPGELIARLVQSNNQLSLSDAR